MLEGMRAKKTARKERVGGDDGVHGDEQQQQQQQQQHGQTLKRHFKQNQVKLKQAKDGAQVEQPEAVQRVLSKIF